MKLYLRYFCHIQIDVSAMIRNISKVAIYTLSTIVVIIGIAFITGIVFNDAIVRSFTNYFNSTQNFKVNSSSVKFSLLSRFPKASVQFTDVTLFIEESNVKDTLIQCNKLFFELDIWKLLDGNIEVKSLVANNGVVNVDLDKIRNAAEIKTNSTTNQNISLNKIVLEQVVINWIDTKSGNSINALAKKLTLNVFLTNRTISVNASGNLIVRNISTPSWEYNKRVDGNIETNLLITNNDITIEQTLLEIQDQSILISGKVDLFGDNAYALQIAAHKLSLNTLSQFFSLNSSLKNVKSGNVTLKANLSGNITHISSPKLSASFIAKGIELSIEQLPKKLIINDVKGALSKKQNANWDQISISLDHIDLNTGSSSATGKLSISDIKRPKITVDTDFHVELDRLIESKSMTGEAYGNIKASFSLNRTDSIRINDIRVRLLDSRINFKGIAFAQLDAISNASGNVEWKNNQFLLAISHGRFNDTPFSASIMITDALSLFDGQLRNPVDFSLSTSKLVFNDLFNPDTLSISESESSSSLVIWNYIPALKGSLDIQEVTFATWSATNISGSYRLDPTDLFVSNASLNAFSGSIKGNVSLFNVAQDNRLLASNVSVKNIDVNLFFKAFNSFDQTAITDKNINGDLSGDIELKVNWASNRIDYSSIESMAKIRLVNGKLANLTQFKELSKFLKYKEIETVSFSKLENEVLIYNNQVLLPSMLIKSNALDLTLSGNHRFDGNYSYKVKFELGDLLSKKWKNSNEYEYEEDNNGNLNMFIKIDGTPAGASVSYDTKSARENFRQNLSKEGQTLKTIFREEFGSKKSNSADTLTKSGGKKNKPLDTITKPKPRFKIEWDELEDTTRAK